MTKEEIEALLSKLAEINITFDFDQYWLTFLLPIAFAAIGAYFGSYLRKSGEIKAVNDNVKNIKEQLKATTKITEEIKSDLAKKTNEHQVKFELYHNKSIEVITTLYSLLSDIQSNAVDYIATANFEEGETETYKKAKESVHSFLHYANRNEIWVPEDLYQQIKDLAKLMNSQVFTVFAYISSKHGTPELAQKSEEKSSQAILVLNDDVPKAKEAILNNIRYILNP